MAAQRVALYDLFAFAQAFERKRKPAEKKGKVKKVAKSRPSSSSGINKASFRCKAPKTGGLKAKDQPLPPVMYGVYDISGLPPDAFPDDARRNGGRHSYTLGFNGGVVEILLQKEAFFVKKVGPTGTGPLGQVSWGKSGGLQEAWAIAKTRSGLDRSVNP